MTAKEKRGYFARKIHGIYDLVKLEYKSSKLALILVIDNHFKGKKKKKKKGVITKDDIMNCQWRHNKLNLFMPKFKFEFEIRLKDTLKEMGIKSAFDENSADFSGMNGEKNMYIMKVIHKAMIKVIETGTEAAASTVVIMGKRGRAMPKKEPKIPTIRFDHPFDFHIIDQEKKIMLFSGRYTGK